jgi:hypothetical protein
VKTIRDYFTRQIAEIESDPVLRNFGVALGATHVLSFVLWRFRIGLERVIGPGVDGLCWPFFENCHLARVLSPGAIHGLLQVYLLLGGAAIVLLLAGRRVQAAYWILVALTAFRLAIVFQDFTLRLNQHYMATLVALVFHFVPNKRTNLRYLILAFYVWAGLLKFDREWLSGAALYHQDRLWVPAALIPASCAYVLVLEVLFVWGVLFKRKWLFWSTFAQLIVFHVFSWTVVGFFYPMIMFCLLAIFPLAWQVERNDPGPSLFERLFRRNAPRSSYAMLAVYSILQLIPYAFPGDSALTGEGRLFALNMFDARVQCRANFTFHKKDGTTEVLDLTRDKGELILATRIQCDPIVYFDMGQAWCRKMESREDFTSLDVLLESKRSSDDGPPRPVMDVRDFCQAGLTYRMWRPNGWILKEPPRRKRAD